VLRLAACTATATTPAFHPRPASRMMTTPTMRIVQSDSTIVLIDRASGDRLPFSVVGELVDAAVALIECEMRTRLAAYAHDDLRTRHVRVVPGSQLAF
jgi:hypothetical protein